MIAIKMIMVMIINDEDDNDGGIDITEDNSNGIINNNGDITIRKNLSKNKECKENDVHSLSAGKLLHYLQRIPHS